MILIFEYVLPLFRPAYLFRCTRTCKFVIFITVIFGMRRLPFWNLVKHYWLRDSYRDWLRQTKTLASLGFCADRHQLLSAACCSVLILLKVRQNVIRLLPVLFVPLVHATWSVSPNLPSVFTIKVLREGQGVRNSRAGGSSSTKC